MRKAAVFIALAFQLIVLLVMAGQREYIVRAGDRLYLRTAPIDPRDLFRGDFVRLDYPFSRIGPRQLGDQLTLDDLRKGMRVYAVLQPGPEGLAELDYLTASEPDGGLFIRGRVRSTYGSAHIAYGIEAYFVEQGKGLEIEQKRGTRGGMQVPMEVEVALGGSGTAVITGHRWSRLGIALQIETVTLENQRDRVADIRLTLTLKNTSQQPLALLDLPFHCSFELVATMWSSQDWQPASDHCEGVAAGAGDVIVLEPGRERAFEMLMSDSRWQLSTGGQPQPVSIMDLPNERFRMVYRVPPAPALAQLEQNALIWRGHLPSRAFSGRGFID